MDPVSRLPQNGVNVTIAANDKELKRLAEAHGLVAVTSFEAQFLIRKWRAGGVKITGVIRAGVIQTCIVTTKPLENKVEYQIEAVFVPEHSKLAGVPISSSSEIVVDFDGPDVPETFSGDTIDVGALAEEFFELGLDPYPRKAGVSFEPLADLDETSPKEPSPFAKLVNIRRE